MREQLKRAWDWLWDNPQPVQARPEYTVTVHIDTAEVQEMIAKVVAEMERERTFEFLCREEYVT